MNAKQKSNSVITHEVDANGVIRFNVLGVGALFLNMDNVSQDVANRAAIHGMIQRISDAAAIPRNTETGQSATPEEKYEAMRKLVEHYESGTTEWSRKPAAGEGSKGGLLFKALCIMSPSKSPDEIRDWMASKTKAQLAVIRTSAKVAAVIDSIRPKDESIDVDAMMDELDI